tara:strand:+ start:89 stop:673 length:585 start_codon:yes stop_codon:yes gene_type:complete
MAKWGLGNILKAMKDSLANQEGFQGEGGGKGYGRDAGPLAKAPNDEYGDALKGVYNRDTPHEMSTDSPDFESFTQNFDEEDNVQVKKLQRQLNDLGYSDYEGASLAEDGVLGEKTISALRMFQSGASPEGIPFEEGQGAFPPDSPSPLMPEGNAPSSWKDWLFKRPASGKSMVARDKLFDRSWGGGDVKYTRKK